MDRQTAVHADIDGKPVLVGQLWSRVRGNRESATLEYDKSWLAHPYRFSLEPALMLGPGPHHTPPHLALFGALGDSAPDRWGRVLMRRAERLKAEEEKRTLRTLFEIDYLLMVDDYARQGALRFTDASGGPFLADGAVTRIPPLVSLPKLLTASEHVVDDVDTGEDIRLLLAPGSSLGGARPKASVRDKDGRLAIAKFPNRHDDIKTVLWEALALKLASMAGINVPDYKVVKAGGRQVLLLKRFDRSGERRIPFISAMSMLGASDNETRSYLELADALRSHGAAVSQDLRELWRRIVFTVMISNTDDHLRNHGFLYSGQDGWRLSPAYDINPVPVDVKPRVLCTAIDMDNTTASLEVALSVAEFFDLNAADARQVARQVRGAVTKWRDEASKLGISSREMERMASAFV